MVDLSGIWCVRCCACQVRTETALQQNYKIQVLDYTSDLNEINNSSL